MRITFPDKTSLVSVLSAVRDFSEFIRLEITGPVAKAVILDSTHVSVTCLEFVVSAVDLDGGDGVVFSISNFLKVLDLGKVGNEVEIEMTPCDDVANVTMDDGAVRAAVKLFDNEMDEMDPPEMEGTTIHVSPSEFATRIKDLANLGDSVTLTPQADSVELSVEADLGTASIVIKATETVGAWDEGMTFALRYLVSILKVSKLFDTLTVIMSNEMPLCIKMKSEYVSVGFFLAPKFKDDDE